MSENIGNSDTSLPVNKTQLMSHIRDEWNALDQLISRLTADQLNQRGSGPWSIKDNLAHLASWEEFMVLHYLHKQPAYQAMQIEEDTFKQLDETNINKILFQRHRMRSPDEVLTFFRNTHQWVLDTLEKMPFSELMKPLDTNDPEARPVLLWVIGNTYDHYAEHRVNIEKILAQG